MATLDLGKIKFTWRGAYSGATAYEKDDVVSYSDSSVYICKLTPPAVGTVPTNTTYWDVMVQGVNILTTLGDLATHNGTIPIRFGIGTSGQVLTANSGAISWAAQTGWQGNVAYVNTVRPWRVLSGTIGTGNEPWLGDASAGGNNLRIASGLPNPRLGPRSSTVGGYTRHVFSCFLNDRFEYVARGDSAYGMVGKFATSTNHANLTAVQSFSGEYGLLRANDHFVQIHKAGTSGSALALTKDGDVFFIGYNGYGLAGAGHTTDVYSWTKVPYLGPDASVSSIPCRIIGLHVSQELNGGESDYATVFAIDQNYRLWTWGYNGNGECGIGNTTSPQSTPQLVSAVSNVRMVHARPRNVALVTNTGQLYTWGNNGYGQLGLGNTTNYTSPQLVSGATSVHDIEVHYGSYYSGGWNHYGAIYYHKTNGELYGSGYNPYGNLGNGNTTNQQSFVRCGSQTFKEFVVNGDGKYILVGAIEGLPSDANDTGGNFYCWGYNGNGQIGNGTTTNASTPTQPGAICDTTRNRTFTYINAVTTNSDRVFPRNLIKRIYPYRYSEAGTGWMLQDTTNRLYGVGYWYYVGSYRSDNSGISYNRPFLMPGPWSSEDGHVGNITYSIVGYVNSSYPYGSTYSNQLLMSDGRILHNGSNGEGEFSSDTGHNGRWMIMNP